MNGGATFNWQSLGKADYAQAHALVASLPEPLRAKLNGSTREVLCRITHLLWLYGQKSRNGRGYAIPSQRYLSKAINRSERTVRRCLETLRDGGLITWIRRQTKGGAWTSNLYSMGKTFLASLYARASKKTQRNQDRTKTSDNDLKKGIEAAPNAGEPASDSAFLRKLRERQPILAVRQSASFAKPVVEEDMSAVDRKAMLKRQAEALKARGL